MVYRKFYNKRLPMVNLGMKCQSHLTCCKNKKLKNLFFYNSKPKLETDFGIKKYKRKYMKCMNCNHLFAYFDFNLDNLYDENYSLKAYGDIKKIKITFNKIIQLPFNKSDNKKRVLRCLKYLKKKDQIFDIGCGLSVFLYELKKKNYKVFGLEPDKYLFKHSKNIIGRNIYNSSIEKFSLTKKKNLILCH